jgi:hypothetical protein
MRPRANVPSLLKQAPQDFETFADYFFARGEK